MIDGHTNLIREIGDLQTYNSSAFVIALIAGGFASTKTYREMDNPFWSEVPSVKRIIILILSNIYVGFFWYILSNKVTTKILNIFKVFKDYENIYHVIIYGILYYGLFAYIPKLFLYLNLLLQ